MRKKTVLHELQVWGGDRAQTTSMSNRQMVLSHQHKQWVTGVLLYSSSRGATRLPSLTALPTPLSSTMKLVAAYVSHCVFAGDDRETHTHPDSGFDASIVALHPEALCGAQHAVAVFWLGWDPTAMLCPQQGCVSLCSGLALDWSSGNSKTRKTNPLHAPHATTCCGNPAEQGLRLLCLTSKYSGSNVCSRSYFLPFSRLLIVQPEALTSFCHAFSSFILPPLPLLFLLVKEFFLNSRERKECSSGLNCCAWRQ